MSTASSTDVIKRSRPKRSRTRRAGESMYGVLLLTRNIVLSLLVLLLLVAAGWASWDTVRPAVSGEGRGTIQIAKCGESDCSGKFVPQDGPGGQGAAPQKVTIPKRVSGETGERLAVALKPDTGDPVRTGPAGVMYGAVPFGGALLLASLIVLGGLRWKRTALVLGLLGAAQMAAAWALLTF